MKALTSIFLSTIFYYTTALLVLLFVLAFFMPILYHYALLATCLAGVLLLLDALMLYTLQGIFARRSVPERLSNGDENPLSIYVENHYTFEVKLEIIDEIPFQFQKRDVLFLLQLQPKESKIIRYQLRPTERGVYHFGVVNIYASSPLRLLQRRFQFEQAKEVAVYPSFLQLKMYDLKAISHKLTEFGLKKIRRIGQSQEFEQIRQYVQGDDIRTINWHATARRNELMVNAFQEEKAQCVYNIIDKGRVMQSPFDGLTLLDYAINASLIVSNVALQKQDKAGLMTFADTVHDRLPAERKATQMNKILEVLYQQTTDFKESSYEALYIQVKKHITQRSLLVIYTNFETVTSMRRQLPYFQQLAKSHLVLVVFFENTAIRALLEGESRTTEDIYQKTIAEKFYYEKEQIVKELEKYGIKALLTSPANLTINTLNRYLSYKSRGLI